MVIIVVNEINVQSSNPRWDWPRKKHEYISSLQSYGQIVGIQGPLALVKQPV